MCLLCTEFIFWDMPFGLGLAEWDTLLSDEELKMFFMQLNIINTSTSTTIALMVHYPDAGRVKAAMEDAGFKGVHPYYVYKTAQNQKGTNCFIYAVEMILIGYKADAKDRKLVFKEKNPVGRHNLLFGHNLRGNRFQLSGQPEPVNTCQKHTGIAFELGSICAIPGSHALVIGSGSGSDVIGCLRAGLNVVGVDKDPSQFHGCKARLTGYIASVDAERKVEELELAQVQHVKEVARAMASWRPDAEEVAEVEELVDMVESSVPPSQSSPPADAGKSKEAKCAVCGGVVDIAHAVSCMLDGCTMGKFLHPDCVTSCAGDDCGGVFCSQPHLEQHVSEEHE